MSGTDFVIDQLPFDAITSPEDAADLAIESMVNGSVGKKDTLKDKSVFNAIVLGGKVSNVPFTPTQISAMFGADIDTRDSKNKYFGYRVRILDFNNPHSFYPIPCPQNRASYFNNVARGMHTLILAKDTESLSEKDTCQVRLIKRGGKYELSYGYFVAKTGRNDNFFNEIHKQNSYLREACSPTGELFNAKIRTLSGGDIGSGFTLPPSSVIEKGSYKGFPVFGPSTPANYFGLKPYGDAKNDYEYVVLHITDGPTSKGAIATLGGNGNSYHYLVEPTGDVVIVLDPNVHTARHGGTNDSNAKSIGISLVNSFAGAIPGQVNSMQKGKYKTPEKSEWYKSTRSASEGKLLQPFTKKQIVATTKLIMHLKSNKSPDSKTSNLKYITGHENIAPGRREDPGPAFDPYWDYVIKNTGLAIHPDYGIK